MALWCLEFYYFRFRIELRTFNQFSGPFWEVERLKAKQSRAPSKSDTVGSRNGVLAERELGLGNLPTRNTLECVIKCQNKYKFSHNSIYMPAAQLELKHRERMLDSRFGIGDSGFGMRDTVSRARLYRQLQSSPESVGGSCHRPALLLLLAASFAGFRQPLSTHFTTWLCLHNISASAFCTAARQQPKNKTKCHGKLNCKGFAGSKHSTT